MLEFSWKVFSQTGNIDTYLLMKEIERESQESNEQMIEKYSELDAHPTN
ncbi:YqzL family protein [Desertibacillus haloalkaliphilus]|nr:YqzL family protein [Desertibacillus haloalkaliphilus]MBU8905672.1 YqzL family protein [Desertibacillus haloalkaliphilus]